MPRQHDNCKICEEHDLFDLDDLVFVHGQRVSKGTILDWKEKAEKYDRVFHKTNQVNKALDSMVEDCILFEQENKQLKEKIGILMAESHIANEQITNMSFELDELNKTIPQESKS